MVASLHRLAGLTALLRQMSVTICMFTNPVQQYLKEGGWKIMKFIMVRKLLIENTIFILLGYLLMC